MVPQYYERGYGTGLSKIKENYDDMTCLTLFETAPGVFKVILPNTYQNRLSTLTSQNQTSNKGSQNTYSDAKDQILKYVNKNGEITRKEVENMLGVKTTKAYKLLMALIDDHKLQAVGEGRNVKYIPY